MELLRPPFPDRPYNGYSGSLHNSEAHALKEMRIRSGWNAVAAQAIDRALSIRKDGLEKWITEWSGAHPGMHRPGWSVSLSANATIQLAHWLAANHQKYPLPDQWQIAADQVVVESCVWEWAAWADQAGESLLRAILPPHRFPSVQLSALPQGSWLQLLDLLGDDLRTGSQRTQRVTILLIGLLTPNN